MNLKIILFSFFIFIISLGATAQQIHEVHGNVADSTGAPLAGVSIKLISASDSLLTSTNSEGFFRFQNVKATAFRLSAMIMGFQPYAQSYAITSKNTRTFETGTIKLKIHYNQLDEVAVSGVNPITIKEDTVEYAASAYKVREGAPVEDMVKKLPGVTVDKDGNITAEGKQISRIRVNGKDFFGGDVQTATQNLPADIIENLQIIDDYGDEANLTGIKEGDPEKILNINIQKGKRKGYFGNGTIAGGNEDRYMGRAMVNNFHEERQISLLGSVNNTNANAFNFNGGGRGGGARGANFGSGERGGGGNGITNSQSAGFNYRNNWGKKVSSYGSYSYSGRKNNTIGTSLRKDINPLNLVTTGSSSDNSSSSFNHRLTWNLEYQIDTANYIKITPYFSSASSDGDNVRISEISKPDYYTLNNSKSGNSSTSPSGGTDLLYNHKFSKRGRNFSLSARVDYSSRNQDRDVNNTYYNVDSTFAIPVDSNAYQYQFIGNDNMNTRTNLRTSYIEPLGKSSFLSLSYAWNKSSTKSIRDVNDIDPANGQQTKNILQSNDYNYQFITNRIGLNFRSVKLKYNYVIGIIAQPSVLEGQDIGRNTNTRNKSFNWVPTARFVYKFEKSNTLTMTYGGSSREPSFNQLQPVSDSSNIKNIVTGNPDLNSEFTNRFSIRYNKFDRVSGNSLFTNLSFDQTNNKIVSNRINDTTGTGRTTTYLNTNGFYGVDGNISYSKPFAERKYTVTVNASASYDNNISFIENHKTQGQRWAIRPGARFRVDLEDIIDADFNVTYSVNKATSRYSASSTRTLILGVDGKNYFFKDWTFGYDFSKVLNYGFGNLSSNPTLLNVFVERRFLKNNRGTLRLQGYDLFNQNTGISSDISGTTTTLSQNNRLARYFLLSFNLRLQKFAGGTFQRGGGNRMRREGGGRNGGGFRDN